jgi:hypothetical protein
MRIHLSVQRISTATKKYFCIDSQEEGSSIILELKQAINRNMIVKEFDDLILRMPGTQFKLISVSYFDYKAVFECPEEMWKLNLTNPISLNV